MTPPETLSLRDRLRAQIAADGPLSVDAFMALCLHARGQGYYAAGGGIGRDFRTAPETSQIFGELIGLWAAQEWLSALGQPQDVALTEPGPGRGTLMADALRATRRVAGFSEAARVHLVEASQPLREVQARTLARHSPTFHDGFDTLPLDAPLLLIANEFLDCLPARQFVASPEGWRERVVGLGPDGGLAWGVSGVTLPPEALPDGQASAEVQTGLDALVTELAGRLHAQGGRALFIDYGPADAVPADTLRAYHAGRQTHPLEAPGRDDLTVDVDFSRLARLAGAQGLDVHGPLAQGAFLLRLGAQARLDALIRARPEQAQALYEGASALIHEDAMGERFKVIVLSAPGLPVPTGFEA
jgi:SAM-dependent MidA family methyltransferase